MEPILAFRRKLATRLLKRYSAGIGITYQYVKYPNISTSVSNYGWSVFNRYNFTQKFFGYAEYERLQFEYFTSLDPDITERFTYDSFLIGAGYTEQLGGKASFSVSALYNVLYDATDLIQPYDSPWVIRAGIGIGLF